MKYFLAIALLLFAFSSHAEIYRGVDEEGNVFYSDKDQANAELIPTPTPNTITMPKLEANKPATEDAEMNPYKSFGIVSPANNATIRDNIGNISITLSLLPALDTKNSHRITIYLDGQATLSTATETNIQLSNVSRGQHSLRAEIRDKNGKPIISSNSVNFHMKRLSGQHKQPSGTSPGSLNSEGKPYKPGPSGTHFIPGPAPPSSGTP